MGKCHRLSLTLSRLLQASLLDLHTLFQQASTRPRILKVELQAVSTNQSKLAQEIEAICQRGYSGISMDRQGRKLGFHFRVPSLPTLWTLDKSLKPFQSCRMKGLGRRIFTKGP